MDRSDSSPADRCDYCGRPVRPAKKHGRPPKFCDDRERQAFHTLAREAGQLLLACVREEHPDGDFDDLKGTRIDELLRAAGFVPVALQPQK